VFAAIVTVPSAFKNKPAGTLSPVSVTFPAAVPITTAFPAKVSFDVKAIVVPPINPFTAAVVSVTASITSTITGAGSVLAPIKQECSFKFRLLIMRLIFSLKLDVYPGSIFP